MTKFSSAYDFGSDSVDDQAADDDPEAKPRQAGAGDGSEFASSEAELGAPVRQNPAAYAETHASREDG